VSDVMTAVEMEDISPVKKRISFDVPWSEVKKEMDGVYQKLSKTASAKGFRKGKVPRNILETLYKEPVEKETVVNLIERLYADALRTNKLLPASRPEIEEHGIQNDQNFNFVATVEVEPAIDPTGYRDLALEKIERAVTDKDVEDKLGELCQRLATIEEIQEDRGVRNGDFITMDFSGTVEGVSRKELSAENFFLELGNKRFIPGFEEQLIGVAKGETKEIKLRFPDDYYATEIAGKDATFTVTLKDIREKKLPVLDDGFIANFAKFNTMEELKEDISQKLKLQYQEQYKSDLHNAIVNEILKINEFEVPDCYVESEYRYITADVSRRMANDGVPKEKAAEMLAKFQDQYRQTARHMVKASVILRRIGRKESINVSESEIEARIEEIASQSGDPGAVKNYFTEGAMKANLVGEILNRKVLEFIENSAQITIVNEDAQTKGEENK